MNHKIVLGASLGDCIHVAGLLNFILLAEQAGHKTIYLGPAVPTAQLIKAIRVHRPDLVALSYRLTPRAAGKLFTELKKEIKRHNLKTTFVFGGTPPVATWAKKSGIFDKVFNGQESPDDIRDYLKGEYRASIRQKYASTLMQRIKEMYPYPLIRHHFGRPTVAATVSGAREIAVARVLDVLSIGPDQNAQEHFFNPGEMDRKQDGAGGVPLRKPADLAAIYRATRCGNFPLVRCYAGTQQLLQWAAMSVKTIHNAWGAIPLCWYSVLDNRSERTLEQTIMENQETMAWYARQGIPVEVNESHQWSLRNAHDALAVAMAFLAAYNAKRMGVKNYVSQYMFNTPPGTSPVMDLAKMLAKKELIEDLADRKFKVFTQVRAGLSSFSSDFDLAKGQLASSAVLSLALKPHIVHVVGYSEGDHAVSAEELIESCKIMHGVLRNSLRDLPDMTLDPVVQFRKKELLAEARALLHTLKKIGSSGRLDPWLNPRVIAFAINLGLLDAPHLKGNRTARGEITTRILGGKCVTIDPKTGDALTEKKRIMNVINAYINGGPRRCAG
jgi:hypothetical protein